MVDSTNLADEPAAELVAYYVDGIYATTEAAVRAKFPKAIPVGISAIGTNAGIVGDVEPGCMTVLGGLFWVLERRKAGVDPTLYVNQMNTWGPARKAFQSQGIPEPHWWVADYDGIAAVPAGAVAKQYANPTLTGGHFDRSVVLDHWPGVDGVFGPGAGTIAAKRRTIASVATAKSLHQFCRGTDHVLYHRKRTAGAWTTWSSLGGELASDVIGVGVDTDGTIVVTVVGTNALFYDTVSTDDGATWSGFKTAAGSGDGLTVLSAAPAASSGGAVPTKMTGTITATLS